MNSLLAQTFKSLGLRTPTKAAQTDLLEAKLAYLEACKHKEYWNSVVQMYAERIDRLEATIESSTL